MASTRKQATVVKNNVNAVVKSIQELAKTRVLIGIPDSTAQRRFDDKIKSLGAQKAWQAAQAASKPPKQPSGPTNAVLGYIHEFGEPSRNIPARPFLVPGVTKATPQIIAIFKQASQLALEGKPRAVEKALNAAGIVASESVRERIRSGPFAPLADRTKAARLRKGRDVKPLIDTAQLLQSITYVLRRIK